MCHHLHCTFNIFKYRLRFWQVRLSESCTFFRTTHLRRESEGIGFSSLLQPHPPPLIDILLVFLKNFSRLKTMPPKHEAVGKSQSKSGKYWQKIKISDPLRYRCHLVKEAARNKRARSQLSEEHKSVQRGKSCLRMRKLPERREAEKQNEVIILFQKKIKDMSQEEREEYDRVRKAEFRSEMKHQNEREKKYRDNCTCIQKLQKRRKAEKQNKVRIHFQKKIKDVSQEEQMPPKHKKEAVVKARSSLYLQKIKVSDPKRYKCYLEKAATKNKRARSQLSEEQKSVQREQSRLRMQKLRERREAEKQNEVIILFQKKIKDMSQEERIEYDRVEKAKYRAKMNHQKKKKVCEREKKYRDDRTVKKKLLLKIKNEGQLSGSISSGVPPSASVLTSRIHEHLSKSASSYAYAIKNLINKCSSKKKLALRKSRINNPNKIQNSHCT